MVSTLIFGFDRRKTMDFNDEYFEIHLSIEFPLITAISNNLTQKRRKELEPLTVSAFIQLPWADHDNWLKLSTTNYENPRTCKGRTFHIKKIGKKDELLIPKHYADLHNHTTASDGDYSPEALVDAAKVKGLLALAVTDHDTIDGVQRALIYGDTVGVEVIPGVEVSVRFKEPLFTGTLHVLTYFDQTLLVDERFKADLSQTLGKGRGDGLVQARVNEINSTFGPAGKMPLLTKPMEFEKVAAYSPTVTRRHFALALNDIHGIENADTINRIIGNDSPAYLPSGVDLDSVGAFIRKYPVVAVLAHPAAGSYPGEGHYKEVLPPLEIVEATSAPFSRYRRSGD